MEVNKRQRVIKGRIRGSLRPNPCDRVIFSPSVHTGVKMLDLTYFIVMQSKREVDVHNYAMGSLFTCIRHHILLTLLNEGG
jgi:hypothetical protein